MPFVMRPYRDEDWPQVASIWSLAFYAGSPIDPERQENMTKGAPTYVAEDEEGIVGASRIMPFQRFVRGVELPAGGLSTVAVAPEYRRQGVGSSMLHWLLWQMRSQGMLLSPLHAASERFYRAFGWANVGGRIEVSATADRLPRLETDRTVHRLTVSDWSELAPAYHAFAQAYSGMHRRSDLSTSYIWRHQGNEPVIYAVGEPVEAYLVVRLQRGQWDAPFPSVPIAEMVWTSPSSYHALLGVARSLLINSTSIRWFEPVQSPFLALHSERDTEAIMRRPLMDRLLAVPAALEQVGAPEGVVADFTIAVEDPMLPDNTGPWRIIARDGEVHVELYDGDDLPDLELSVGAMTQALLGEPDITALAHMGQVVVRIPAALQAAARLWPPHPVFCLDYF